MPKRVVGLVALGGCAALAMLVTLALAPVVMGWRTDVVVSGSMAPRVRVGDAIVAQPFHGQRLRIGTVAVFRDSNGRRVSHRIIAVHRDGSYATKGDANPLPDSTPVFPKQVIGVGRLVIPSVGLPVVWAQQRQWLHVALLGVALGFLLAAARWSFAGRGQRRPRLGFPRQVTRQQVVRGLAISIAVELSLAIAVLAPARANAAFMATTANPTSSFVAAPSWRIARDSVSSKASAGAVSSLTWSHTVAAGTGRILVVGVTMAKHDVVVGNITYGGVGGFVKAGTQFGTGGENNVEIWYQVAPTVGTANVVVTLTGPNVEMVGAATSLTGVDQATPVGPFVGGNGTSTSPAITVASATDELVVAVMSNQGDAGTLTEGAGQTQLWAKSTGFGGANNLGVGSSEPGAPSVTVSWTTGKSSKWALGAITLKPA